MDWWLIDHPEANTGRVYVLTQQHLDTAERATRAAVAALEADPGNRLAARAAHEALDCLELLLLSWASERGLVADALAVDGPLPP